MLGVAAVTALLFQWLRQPSVLGYLVAGLIVGRYLPVALLANEGRVHALSEFGVVLVMFTVGLEFRLKRFLTVLPVAGVTGILEIGALMAAGYFLGGLLGWSEVKSLFLGACICISSTMTVSKIMEQRPVPAQNRSLIFGVLVIQDVAAIALIAVMTAISRGEDATFGQIVSIVGKLSATLFGIIAVGMFFVPRFVRILERTKSREVLVVGATGICFSFAILAQAAGYSAALGAFIGGVLVAESGLGHQVEKATSAVKDMFVAVFFVSIGMSVDPTLAWETLPTSLLVLAVVVITQLISVSLAGTASGNGIQASVTAGLALGQIGEFAFIIGAIGFSSGILGPDFQSVLVTVAVFSTLTTSLLLKGRRHVLGAVEHLVPHRVARVLVLYESWWSRLREPSVEPRHRISRIIVALTLDFGMMLVLVLAWQTWRAEQVSYVMATFEVDRFKAMRVTELALGLALLPLLVPLIFGARRLAITLSERVFSEEHSNARAVFRASIGTLVVAGLGVPGALLLGRAFGIAYVWPAFLVSLALSAWLLWRRIGSLDTELQSGGLIMLQAIAGQGFGEARAESRPSLPGLDQLRAVHLTPSSYAVGRTLTELALRSQTGASVVAIRSGEGAIVIPTGGEPLGETLILYLAGTHESQVDAERLLLDGPTASTDEDPTADSER